MLRQFVIPVLMIGALSGQTTQAPRIRISFPEGHSEKASMTYGLHDPASRVWRVHNRTSAQLRYSFPEISAQTDRFKALVWAPRCEMKRFDVQVEKSDIELEFTCDPLKTVRFHGRVEGVEVGDTARISVDYVSMDTLTWFYDSKGLNGSFAAPLIHEVAAAAVALDGTFNLELPDFSADPIVSGDRNAGFDFHISGLNEPYLLDPQSPEGTAMGSIPVAPSYPAELVFRATPSRDPSVHTRMVEPPK